MEEAHKTEEPEIVFLFWLSLSEKKNPAPKSLIVHVDELPILPTAGKSNHCFQKLFKNLNTRSAKFNKDNLMRKSYSIACIGIATCKQRLY